MRLCDYSTSLYGKKCNKKQATKIVRVKYSKQEQDAFYLCDDCAELLRKTSIENKWNFKLMKYTGGDQ